MKTKWWILIFVGTAGLCLLAIFLLPSLDGGSRVAVYSDGELVREIDLSAVTEAYTFTVSSPYGENEIQVEPGGVYVRSADCPDGDCLRQAPLPESGRPIVCLPHRLVLRSLGEDQAPYDAIAGAAG